jgi:hypothetical protein
VVDGMADQTFANTQTERRRGRSDFQDPKKHYVRMRGWLPAFQASSQATNGKVRYLTLCGKLALDIRYFAQKKLLKRNEEANWYPDVTFVESDDEDYAIIAESLGRVRLGIKGQLEEVLLDPTHVSYDDLKSSFPYDIINLDFCGAIVPKHDHPYSATLRCIDRVVELQASSNPRLDWRLFLTFNASKGASHEDANAQLCDMIKENLKTEENRSAYGTRSKPENLLANEYPEFLRIGIAKFLAFIGRAHGYEMSIEQSFSYSRHDGAYRIVKVVANLRNLRSGTDIPSPAKEQQAYDTAVKRLFSSAPVDVDAELASCREEIERELELVRAELKNIVIA